MMRIIIIFLFFLLPGLLKAQLKQQSFKEVDSLQKTGPRKMVVFIYTEWCRYCNAMKQTTFKNQKIVDKLNKEFYHIRLDGESRQDLKFKDKVYKYIPSGNGVGTHALAKKLGSVSGKLSYPTLTILNKDLDVIYQDSGYIHGMDLLHILEKL